MENGRKQVAAIGNQQSQITDLQNQIKALQANK